MNTVKGHELGPTTLIIDETAKVYDTATIDRCGSVRIGPYCEVEEGVYVWSHRHHWGHDKGPRRDIQFVERVDVEICEDAFIGTNAQLHGCHRVGKGAVIGCGAVVTRDVPDYEVWGGVPAKKLYTRGERDE